MLGLFLCQIWSVLPAQLIKKCVSELEEIQINVIMMVKDLKPLPLEKQLSNILNIKLSSVWKKKTTEEVYKITQGRKRIYRH